MMDTGVWRRGTLHWTGCDRTRGATSRRACGAWGVPKKGTWILPADTSFFPLRPLFVCAALLEAVAMLFTISILRNSKCYYGRHFGRSRPNLRSHTTQSRNRISRGDHQAPADTEAAYRARCFRLTVPFRGQSALNLPAESRYQGASRRLHNLGALACLVLHVSRSHVLLLYRLPLFTRDNPQGVDKGWLPR